ncbi:MAG: type II 3-dehydroquinate dehydratase [Ruthenibacterium sp.]
MKLLVLNGPNLNFLGIREPEIYGTLTYDNLVEYLTQEAQKRNVELTFFQSNHEGALVDAIQHAYQKQDGIIINPAAYTHTSVAILDALKAVNLPAAEVHLSDVTTREAFRQISYAGLACQWHFIGEGREGYVHAMEALIKSIQTV